MEVRHPAPGALLEDYKLKVTSSESQINRLQTQFQVILSLQALLATALVVSNTGSLSTGAKWIALLELALSVAWLMLGWAGTARTQLHRLAVEQADEHGPLLLDSAMPTDLLARDRNPFASR